MYLIDFNIIVEGIFISSKEHSAKAYSPIDIIDGGIIISFKE